MKNQSMIEKLERKQALWDKIVCVLMVASVLTPTILMPVYATDDHSGINIAIFAVFGFIMSMPLFKGIERLAELVTRHYFKSYYIEEQDNAILLYGSVKLVDYSLAVREIMSRRKGYKLIELDEAFSLYGCTLAAVPASQAEIEVKREVESFGLAMNSIS